LTSKVGILITIIGIFIGAKYAIEHDLISPAMRILAGYVSGLVLIGLAIRLKKNYEQYSSVLMGGGLAVLYFITYIAYSFYEMMPQTLAFALMLVFTAGTVYASLLYNQVIIAHLGLVGAYAIPILLSDQSGRFIILFTYIAIINAGILVLSFRKYWKSLFYLAFVLTWLIFGGWFSFKYMPENILPAFIFLSVFFLIFYATFLAYKLVKKEQYGVWDVVVLLSNAFIFYGFGYAILDEQESTARLLGIFTLVNAAVHFTISMVIKRLQLADKALFYLLLGLVIAFVTIAVPVQLDGNWVTLLWTVEAVAVFFIGRTQQRDSYEKLGVILIILSFFSLLQDWSDYNYFTIFLKGVNLSSTPFLNIMFFTGLLVAGAHGAILYLHHRKKRSAQAASGLHVEFYNYALPCLFLAIVYFSFQFELNAGFRKLMDGSSKTYVSEIDMFRYCALLLYTMTFVAVVTWVNERYIRKKTLAVAAILAIGLCTAVLLVSGLELLNGLSEKHHHSATYFGIWNELIRYILIGFAALLLWLGNRSLAFFNDRFEKTLYGVFIQVTILAIISFEYLKWMNLLNTSADEYKLGLSIVWSVYALGLVIMGINKKKKHWRLTGICFFIITLIKLFAYDLSQATTISKTISFISLGVILLLVSYLYNRYKHVILADDDNDISS
ncbi:MAG: DUF2339 domain-containing protein, partial [Chitinophagaceae bacterium]